MHAAEVADLARRAERLLDAGDAERAAEMLQEPTRSEDCPVELLGLRTRACYELDRLDEAEALGRTLLRRQEGPAAWHGLGLTLQLQRRYAEAEEAFRAAIRHEPHYALAHEALSDLVWMRTGDLASAVGELDRALRREPRPALVAVMVRHLVRAGAAPQAYQLALRALPHARPDDPTLHVSAARAAQRLDDPRRAVAHAREACAAAPGRRALRELLAETLLQADDPAPALDILAELLATDPGDQSALALQALGWRMTDDPRYRELHDYQRMVRSYTIDPPAGWPDLAAFLSDLAGVLHRLHDTGSRTLGQSHQGGSKTWRNLARSHDPVVKALLAAIRGPVGDYCAALASGGGPLARVGGDWRVKSAWSVRLAPGGWHSSHYHPDGWISSAFYVELPEGPASAREGWLKFGEPPFATAAGLQADHFVEPKPGRLVLFPSYMLHGTTPSGGERPRLAVAFDVVPADQRTS